ncbi:hypothetical protein, partial [Salmonella enterica]|uniref:hypothetical protein n=1 Tax=Salmonella enterica TaxID=28901 RepID=UPI00398C449C
MERVWSTGGDGKMIHVLLDEGEQETVRDVVHRSEEESAAAGEGRFHTQRGRGVNSNAGYHQAQVARRRISGLYR